MINAAGDADAGEQLRRPQRAVHGWSHPGTRHRDYAGGHARKQFLPNHERATMRNGPHERVPRDVYVVRARRVRSHRNRGQSGRDWHEHDAHGKAGQLGRLNTRVETIDWSSASTHLDGYGWAMLKTLLTAAECESIAGLYGDDRRFRSHVVMARHGFGRGEYKYFAYPLPDIVAELRMALYPRLVAIANRWNESMGIDVRFPDGLGEFIERCHKAGQTRPTPLLLKYAAGDFNALHQDLYGEHVFPLQVTILLSDPEKEFDGGEFVLTEQRPRMQTRAEVVPLRQGDAVVFAVRDRPVQGTRGAYRVRMRHGVSRLRSGRRYTVGLIFHDAK